MKWRRAERASTASILRVAVVSGVGVGLLPAALVLMLYLPVRLAWRRDVAAVRAGLAASGGEPGFESFLAHRALAALPWDALSAIHGDPWRALGDGDVRALAAAELERLGLRRP